MYRIIMWCVTATGYIRYTTGAQYGFHLVISIYQYVVCLFQWVTEWKEHESLSLFVEIIKLCTPGIQNYLAQCIYHR